MGASYGLFLLLLLLASLVHPYVVVNSNDPIAASSAVYYANARGEEIHLIYPDASFQNVPAQIGERGEILLIEPSGTHIIPGLRESLESRGNRVEILSSDASAINLELASRSGTRKFIVSDPVYGYNVVSAVAYAKRTQSYLIFANSTNSDNVAGFLSSRDQVSVLYYGTLDDQVKESIRNRGINTRAIDNGDKYHDNVELLEEYFSIAPEVRSVFFSDGSVLEESLIIGEFPTVLVSTVIPDRTYEFMFEKTNANQIQAGTLIGPTNLDAVYDMMKKINVNFEEKRLSVYVKFGQASSRGGEPMPLSTFPLPYPFAQVSLDSASYNPSLGAFELVYTNKGNAQAYVKSSINIFLSDQQVGNVGDGQPYVIRRGESKGMRYPFANPGEGQLAINDTTYYGISKFSFDKGFIKYMDVGRVSFVDNSQVSVSEASYSPLEDKLTLRVRNNGSEDAFYRLTVAYVNDEGLTVYEEESVRGIAAGRNDIVTLTGVIQLPQEKADSTQMNVTAAYGAREAFLEKEATALVKIESFPWWILLLLLLLLLIAYWYYRKRKGEKEAKAEKKK